MNKGKWQHMRAIILREKKRDINKLKFQFQN